MMSEKQICPKCGCNLTIDKFWTKKDLTKDCVCKNCRVLGLSYNNPSDYFPLMEYFDIPYVKKEWEWLIESHNNGRWSALTNKNTSI